MTVRRSYHRLSSSVLYIALTLLLGAGAINSQNNLLFLAFALAVAALIVSALLSSRMMMGLSASRELPEWGAVGAPLTIDYTLHNSNKLIAAFALRLSEDDSPSSRFTPAATWMKLMPPPRASVAHISPKDSTRVYATIIPSRRGAATFSAVRLASAFPLGFFTRSISMEARRTIPILPRIVRLRRDATAELVARAASGERCAPSRGAGEEFFGLREYSPGDSPRSVAWRASARLDTLVVREHTAPRTGSVIVILSLDHTDAEPDAHDRLEDAITLAASLLADAAARGMDAGLAVPACRILIPPAAGLPHRFLLLSALASIDAADLATASHPVVAPAEDIDSALNRCAPGAARILVHPGPLDPALAPANAPRLTASDLARLSAESDCPLGIDHARDHAHSQSRT